MALADIGKMGIYETSGTELGKKIYAIVRYAGAKYNKYKRNHADVIVFEYLEMQEDIGKEKQKLHSGESGISKAAVNIRQYW